MITWLLLPTEKVKLGQGQHYLGEGMSHGRERLGSRSTIKFPGLGRACLLHLQLPYLEAGGLLRHYFQGITMETQRNPERCYSAWEFFLSNQPALGDLHVCLLFPSRKLYFQSPETTPIRFCQGHYLPEDARLGLLGRVDRGQTMTIS